MVLIKKGQKNNDERLPAAIIMVNYIFRCSDPDLALSLMRFCFRRATVETGQTLIMSLHYNHLCF